MDRRKFLIRSIAAGVGTLSVGKLGGDSLPQSSALKQCGTTDGIDAKPQMRMQSQQQETEAYKDGRFLLRIAPVVVQLSRKYAISTVGYNGTSPGPLLRMREGVPVTVDVSNDTDVPELVHWHGMIVPPEVDGVEDEGTPFIAPHSTRRYQFVPGPAGTRWYHTQVSTGIDLYRGLYTGQFGFVYVEPKIEPGRFDQEYFLALREWEPFYSPQKRIGQRNRNDLKIGYRMFSINDKALGSGEPLRVKQGHRVLFHILNASATEHRTMALPGHRFQVVALDGNAVPRPQSVDVLQLGPGERVDAVVDMHYPGVWIFGCTNDADRNKGLGVVVEYAGQTGFPQWATPPNMRWDYTKFGRTGPHVVAEVKIRLAFETIPDGHGGFESWRVNGRQHLQEFALREGARYRLILDNRSGFTQPIHLHRHLFEIVDIDGQPTAGIMKDTIVVAPHGEVSVDVVADQAGLSLLHCQVQQHSDCGFKALFRCA
jgi:FtsP/CotA-like multicopper oxidase with cupredoxin domain